MSTLVLTAIGLPLIRNECRRHAIAQVRTIVADPTRADQVRQAFADLFATEAMYRRAA